MGMIHPKSSPSPVYPVENVILISSPFWMMIARWSALTATDSLLPLKYPPSAQAEGRRRQKKARNSSNHLSVLAPLMSRVPIHDVDVACSTASSGTSRCQDCRACRLDSALRTPSSAGEHPAQSISSALRVSEPSIVYAKGEYKEGNNSVDAPWDRIMKANGVGVVCSRLSQLLCSILFDRACPIYYTGTGAFGPQKTTQSRHA